MERERERTSPPRRKQLAPPPDLDELAPPPPPASSAQGSLSSPGSFSQQGCKGLITQEDADINPDARSFNRRKIKLAHQALGEAFHLSKRWRQGSSSTKHIIYRRCRKFKEEYHMLKLTCSWLCLLY